MRGVTQLEIQPGIIDLGAGQPSPELLPVEIVRRAAAACTAGDDYTYLAYGYPQGHGLLRGSLARFLTPEYGFEVDPESLLITAGASQALDLICTLFTQPGDMVLVEEPTYFLALRIFADHGLKVVSVPMDHQGLRTDLLEKVLEQTSPVLLYTIPTYHNPAGVTLSRTRRETLIQFSQHYNFNIVADEVYHLLSYGDPPPPPMASQIHRGRIFSLGSFSKILAPGLRLGWIQTSSKLMALLVDCGLLDSGGGMNPLTAALVHRILEHGDQAAHLIKLKHTYRIRMGSMDRALKYGLGEKVTYHKTQGGYFRWVKFHDEVDTSLLIPRAKDLGVKFQPGVNFSAHQKLTNYLRLSWAYYPEDGLKKGIQRIGQLL